MKAKQFFSIFLALCLAAGLAFSAGVAAHAADEVTVTILAQIDDTGFVLAPTEVTVAAGLAESYGYDDKITSGVSVADAIVAAHILLFGEDAVNENFIVSSSFFATTLLGVETGGSCGYFQNGEITDVANEVAIADGDEIAIYVYQEDWGMDILTWFELDGARVTSLAADYGASVEFEMHGIMAAAWGDWAEDEDVLGGAGIVPVTLSGMGATFGDVIAVSDEDGLVTLTFNQEGTFIYSAIDVGNDWEIPLLSPWLVVTVEGAEDDDDEPEELTCLEKWQARLPEWLAGIISLPNWVQWIIMVVGFGWIWWLFK